LTSFRGFFEANAWSLRYFGIYYTPDLGATRVADAASDASLTTYINLKTGVVWRRIKHFSGYNVAAGRDDEESPTAYGSWNLSIPSFSIAPSDLQLDTVEEIQQTYPRMGSEEAEAMLHAVRAAKKSGYILASG
ncbi:MAG: hypothetical protein ACREBE_18030, partial [bacterium]